MKSSPHKLARTVRMLILLGVWALITTVTIQHQRLGGGPEGAPTVDALCPFGGLATLYKVAAGGGYLKRVFPSAVVLLVGTVLSALVLRRGFCGWVCPLGAMQEFFAGIGRKLRLRRSVAGNPVDGAGRYVKYAVLVVVIALTWATGTLVFRPYDPWAAYAHLSAGWSEISGEFLIGTIALFATVLGSLVLERTWCRYLCPLGGFLGAISRVGATKVVRNEATCIHCQRCDKACPVDIPVEAMLEVRSTECLTCGECVAVCPVPQTLQFRMGRRPVSVLTVGLLAVGIFFGAVGVSKGLGLWQSLPPNLDYVLSDGSHLDPANIRGFMSLSEISTAFGVPAAEIIVAAGLPADTPQHKPVKTIMPAVGREVEEIREAVAALLATSPPHAPPSGSLPTAPAAPAVTGASTFAGIEKDFGVPAAKVIAALGLPDDTPRDKPLRDIMRPLGRHVTEVRDLVTKLSAQSP